MTRELAPDLVSPPFGLEALHAFRRDGSLIERSLFGPREMNDISGWTDEVAAFPEVAGKHMVYDESSLRDPGQRVLSRIENFCPYHESFDNLLATGRVMSCIDALFDEPAVRFKDKINYKVPGGDGFKAHQDVQAGWDRYAPRHITMLVSIDDATPANGCLELAPALHREGLLGRRWKPLEEDRDIAYTPYPTKRGDAVFFDSFTPHRSSQNLTDSARRILYVSYNRVSDGDNRHQYYRDKRASYPPGIERVARKELCVSGVTMSPKVTK